MTRSCVPNSKIFQNLDVKQIANHFTRVSQYSKYSSRPSRRGSYHDPLMGHKSLLSMPFNHILRHPSMLSLLPLRVEAPLPLPHVLLPESQPLIKRLYFKYCRWQLGRLCLHRCIDPHSRQRPSNYATRKPQELSPESATGRIRKEKTKKKKKNTLPAAP